METDHNSMQREWASVSAQSGARVTATSPQMQGQVSRLERLSGSDFDRAYMTAMVQNHQQAVNTFDTRGRMAQSLEVRQLVARTLPLLQEHLTLARQVAGQVGSDTTTATIAGMTNKGKSADISKDRKFVRDVDADHNLEIKLGQLAEKRARDESVKQFGRRMVSDHTGLKERWTTMISNSGMKFKSGMGPRHKSKLDRLEKLSGREFDREYMTLVAQNHQDYLNYFRKEGRAAKSAPVRQLVNRDIPMLEQHIQQAKQIGVRVGADTITTRVGRISARER
jgi:putative membrane protein